MQGDARARVSTIEEERHTGKRRDDDGCFWGSVETRGRGVPLWIVKRGAMEAIVCTVLDLSKASGRGERRGCSVDRAARRPPVRGWRVKNTQRRLFLLFDLGGGGDDARAVYVLFN